MYHSLPIIIAPFYVEIIYPKKNIYLTLNNTKMDSSSSNNYPLSPADNRRKGKTDGEEEKGMSINN